MGNFINILLMLILGGVCFWMVFVGIVAILFFIFGATSIPLAFLITIGIVVLIAVKK